MTDLSELLERCRAAQGPDEALAVDILYALDIASYITDDGDPTASIDAALALVESKLPGVWWFMSKGKVRPDEPMYAVHLMPEGWDPDAPDAASKILAEDEGHTLALALLCALLTALIQQAKDA